MEYGGLLFRIVPQVSVIQVVEINRVCFTVLTLLDFKLHHD